MFQEYGELPLQPEFFLADTQKDVVETIKGLAPNAPSCF